MSLAEGKKRIRSDLFQRTLKATIVTIIVGVILLIFWMFVTQIFANYPEFQMFFAVLTWALIIFTFTIRFTNGTIYKYGFIIARAFFLMIFVVYATKGGVLTMDIMDFHFLVEFIPLLALTTVTFLLEIGKGILQIIEFTSEAPRD